MSCLLEHDWLISHSSTLLHLFLICIRRNWAPPMWPSVDILCCSALIRCKETSNWSNDNKSYMAWLVSYLIGDSVVDSRARNQSPPPNGLSQSTCWVDWFSSWSEHVFQILQHSLIFTTTLSILLNSVSMSAPTCLQSPSLAYSFSLFTCHGLICWWVKFHLFYHWMIGPVVEWPEPCQRQCENREKNGTNQTVVEQRMVNPEVSEATEMIVEDNREVTEANKITKR